MKLARVKLKLQSDKNNKVTLPIKRKNNMSVKKSYKLWKGNFFLHKQKNSSNVTEDIDNKTLTKQFHFWRLRKCTFGPNNMLPRFLQSDRGWINLSGKSLYLLLVFLLVLLVSQGIVWAYFLFLYSYIWSRSLNSSSGLIDAIRAEEGSTWESRLGPNSTWKAFRRRCGKTTS